MPKGKIGFEQLNENLQQKIELGGSGGGGGVGFLKNTVNITTSSNTVKIGLNFEPGTDALLVFKNSTYQELNHDYTIDTSGKYIKNVSGQWIASEEAPVTFNFILLRTVPLVNSITANTSAVGFIRKTVVVEEDTNEIELDLMYNKVTDAILVFKNSVLIEAEEDYTIDMDRQVLINPNSNWVAGTLLNLMVFKSVPIEDVRFDGNIIEDGSIPVDKLSPEFNLLINNVVKDFQTSIDQLNDDMNYQTAGGTGTAITLRLGTLKQGYNKTFIAIANNNGAATTVNGKPLYKPNTTTPPNIISGKAYTIWYDTTCDCFFLKASAEGNAPQSSVLAGHTFSNDDDTGLAGTMNDLRGNNVYCGAEGVSSLNVYSGNAAFGQLKITPSPSQQPNGFINHTTTFETHLSNLIPSNIKAGVTIADKMTGTFTSDATAQAGHILSGVTAYVNGNKVTGNIPYMNGTWADQWETREISRGQYSYNNGGMYAYMKVPANHYINGVNWIASYQPDLWEGNIVSGKNIFGVQGNATIESLGGRRFASGVLTPYPAYRNAKVWKVDLPPLPFAPSFIYMKGTVRIRSTSSTYTDEVVIFNPCWENKRIYTAAGYASTNANHLRYESGNLNTNPAPTQLAANYIHEEQGENRITWYAWS